MVKNLLMCCVGTDLQDTWHITGPLGDSRRVGRGGRGDMSGAKRLFKADSDVACGSRIQERCEPLETRHSAGCWDIGASAGVKRIAQGRRC